MGRGATIDTVSSAASEGKAPRTARGARTLRKLLDAAREEFADHGFSDSSIVGITRRAGVALGTFYTYFDSKEAVFRALVSDMSAQVRDHVAPAMEQGRDALDRERLALEAFLRFARSHRAVYRIIDEAEFVEPAGFREHYETTAARIAARLGVARDGGGVDPALSDEDLNMLSWAIMGANVFLGLRFAVWESADPARVAEVTSRMLRRGLGRAE